MLGYLQSEWDAELDTTVAATAAAAVPPAVPTGKAGKEKEWAEMSRTEQAAATVLQYTQSSWDAGEATSVCSKPWSTLSDNERSAAQART